MPLTQPDWFSDLEARWAPADTARHYDQAREVRDQQMVARRPDLCLAFVRHTGEVLPLEKRASAAGIPVQRVPLP